MAGLQTEFEFVLPKGFIDSEGNLHRKGVMRLATAMDEIAPLRDPRVRENQAYLSIVLLARVIKTLGTIKQIDTGTVEKMFSTDLAYLQAMYNRVNSATFDAQSNTICPTCGRPLSGELKEGGEPATLGG